MYTDPEDVPLPSSDDETSELEDCDTCNSFEMNQHFKFKYKILDEMASTMHKDYILSLCKDESLTRLAAGLSGTSVNLFDISSERSLSPFAQLPSLEGITETMTICGVRFVDETPNLLLVGTTNGSVRLFDLRTLEEQMRFENYINDTQLLEISSFDCNSNGRLLCTGTEQTYGEVFLNFYDMRQKKLMGSYSDSHQDDVTAIRFHPENPDTLATGSTDGLINIFDLNKEDEEDALLITINTESSVLKLNWHKNDNDKYIISCITHTDFKTYESGEGDLVGEFERDQITAAIKRTTPANCNLIDAYNTVDNDLILLTGSNLNKGEILRSLRVRNKELFPFAVHDGNKQVVRESVYDMKTNLLFTAGESCIITLWTMCDSNAGLLTDTKSLKLKNAKQNKIKPY